MGACAGDVGSDALAGEAVRGIDRLLATMDRLRSPGGCPWDAEQTHLSLARYTLEEAHEVVEALETPDMPGLREELGDLLLQIVFHARISQESPGGFSLDDVAAAVSEKLIRRHPEVFGAGPVADAGPADDRRARWEEIKRREHDRRSVTEGLPPGLPPLAALTVLYDRAQAAGLDVDATSDPVLLRHCTELAAGIDIAAAERAMLRRYSALIRAAESAAAPASRSRAAAR